MKKIYFILSLICICINILGQNVGIGTSTPNASAQLDVTSTTKGLLTPRMNSVQRVAINAPIKGLLVFDTDTNTFWYYNGTIWVNQNNSTQTNAWSLNGNTGIVASNFLGTLDNQNVLIKTKNIDRISIGFNDTITIKNTTLMVDGKTDINGASVALTAGPVGGNLTTGGVFNVLNKYPFFGTSTQDFNLKMDGSTIQSTYISPNIFTGTTQESAKSLLLNPFGGNVGIGTSSPAYAKLEINGSVGATVAMFGADAAGVAISANNPEIGFNYFFNGTPKTIQAGYGANLGMSPGNGDVYIGNFSGNTSTSNFGNIAGYQNCMTIKQNGNIGIGTANPTYKLSVNGNVRSKEVVVETGWADFVFDKKYVLPSLNEVEKYIKINNHLPNIPSAKDVQTNGLKVGEMQTKMMQKIEELTLYVIELKKEIELLKIKK